MSLERARQALIAISAIGVLLFAALFIMTYASDQQVRKSAISFVKYKITKEGKENRNL